MSDAGISTGDAGGEPSPDQLTPSPKPANDAARRRIAVGLLFIIPVGLIAFEAVILLDPKESFGWRLHAGLVIVFLGAVLAAFAPKAMRPFLHAYRIARSRCIHCGRDFTTHHSTRCPKCGKDPVES